MQGNRRNYYRILQVQPEAPVEVIKASWRALMCSAKMHPDLGGNHDAAALINEAFEVLSNPEKKRLYDARMKIRHGRTTAAEPAHNHAGQTPAGTTPPTSRKPPSCALCEAAVSGPIREDSRCQRCESPLISAGRPGKAEREPLGRRTGARWPRNEPAELRCGWPAHCVDARLLDMSMGGLSFRSAKQLESGAVVRISTRSFDSVVQVISSRPDYSGWRTRARFLTLMRLTRVGSYLSKQA